MTRMLTRAVIGVVAALMLSLVGMPGAMSADVVPVEDLISTPERYAGTTVTVEGELIGDYGFRREGTMWTQLNDDSYAREAVVDGGPLTGGNVGIGIMMPKELAAGLDPVGGYRLEGPLVQATGTWMWHDPDRGGESYLAVESLVVVKGGRRLEEGPDWLALGLGATFLAGAALLWATSAARREKV